VTRLFRVLSIAAALGCRGSSETGAPAPPNAGINVLLVTIDTLRPDHLSSYGYPRKTSPSIDELAAKGVSFDLAFTYWPKTRGSFAAMFTSLYSSQHGLTVRERDLPDFNQTMAETFQKAGYRTAAAVDNGNLDPSLGFAQGFDEYEASWLRAETESERTEIITRFGEEFLARRDERPFFLWLHYVNPHTPYEPPEDLLESFRDDGIVARGTPLPEVVGFHGGVNRNLAERAGANVRSWGDYVDRYDAEILFADQQVGRVLKALEASAWASATAVVLTSDHGESLGEHDYFFDHGDDLFNPSLRVPLILSFPGILPPGERVSGAVSTLDVFPTILDLAQVSFPPGLMGKSVLPLVRGTRSSLHEALFFQNDRHSMAISNGRLKLIAEPAQDGENVSHALYDMFRDPAEEEDRYQGAESRVAPLQAELSSFSTRTVAWQQATSSRRAGTDSKGDEELSEAARRSLEALGYLSPPKPQKEKKEEKD
jgi:arylsulfatase A-like enzyme